MRRYASGRKHRQTRGQQVPKPIKLSRIKIKTGSVAGQQAIKVHGVDAILKKFNELPNKAKRKVIRPALRNGGKRVLKRSKELVPYDMGGHQLSPVDGMEKAKHLRDTLKLRVAKPKRRGDLSFKVVTGTRKELGIPADEKGYYPFALEYGSLAWQPIPFMRPAYKQMEQPVIDSARMDIAQGIESIVRGG
jgi:HK97 gp10 family phage protein